MKTGSFINKSAAAAFLLIIFLSCASFDSLPSQDQVCLKGKCFNVELAQNEVDRRRGLQFRQSLDVGSGMLFIFPTEDTHLFWMKDTLISLDMIWVNKDRKVVDVASRALPCPKDPCPTYGSETDSIYVLEINAGLIEKLKIHLGDQVIFKIH